MNGKDDPFRELAIPLDKAAELLLRRLRRNLRVPIEAVADNWDECRFDGRLGQVEVICAQVVLEPWDPNLERSRNSQDIMLAVVEVADLKRSLRPEQLVSSKDNLARCEFTFVATLALSVSNDITRDNPLFAGQVVVEAFVGRNPSALR